MYTALSGLQAGLNVAATGVNGKGMNNNNNNNNNNNKPHYISMSNIGKTATHKEI